MLHKPSDTNNYSIGLQFRAYKGGGECFIYPVTFSIAAWTEQLCMMHFSLHHAKCSCRTVWESGDCFCSVVSSLLPLSTTLSPKGGHTIKTLHFLAKIACEKMYEIYNIRVKRKTKYVDNKIQNPKSKITQWWTNTRKIFIWKTVISDFSPPKNYILTEFSL